MQFNEYEWKNVTREEMISFIKNYPKPLEQDFFMDWYSWNDFSDGKRWPESMVAKAFEMYDKKEYQIKEYINEN